MLIINCPFCGPRDECEFNYGGPARDRRPENSTEWSEDAWREYLLVPPNPMGDVAERWWHARGCGTWFTVMRNTMTHAVTSLPEEQPGQSGAAQGQEDSS